jgi:hypothetical protein
MCTFPLCACLLQMLWIHGQITPWATMRDLLLPSLISTAVPVAALCAQAPELQGPVTRPSSTVLQTYQPQQALPERVGGTAPAAASALQAESQQQQEQSAAAARLQPRADLQLEVVNRDVLVLSVGLGALLFVPLFKYLTGLPPYMGMLSGLGILWMVTDALHFGESKQYPRVQDALRNLDIGECGGARGWLHGAYACSCADMRCCAQHGPSVWQRSSTVCPGSMCAAVRIGVMCWSSSSAVLC